MLPVRVKSVLPAAVAAVVAITVVVVAVAAAAVVANATKFQKNFATRPGSPGLVFLPAAGGS